MTVSQIPLPHGMSVVYDADGMNTGLVTAAAVSDAAKLAYRYANAGKEVTIFGKEWYPIRLPAEYVDTYIAKSRFRTEADKPTCAATGTIIAGGVAEAAIVTGGETLILTLTNATWPAAGTAFNAIRQSIIDMLVATASPTHGWNNDLKAVMAVTTVVRTSNTVVTVTTPAAGTYAIAADETVTIGPLPDTLGIVADGDVYPYTITPSPATFVITNA